MSLRRQKGVGEETCTVYQLWYALTMIRYNELRTHILFGRLTLKRKKEVMVKIKMRKLGKKIETAKVYDKRIK